MIDIKRAEEEFKNYSKNYDMSESHIERKVRHTYRVESLCEKIAISLGMNKEQINLAKLIGLLHDIARFEQYTIYKTYSDHKSIDHGSLGVKILEENNYIRKYIETDRYDEIIKKAIYNHNKYSIQENLSKEEKIYSEIIRDADKLDIMYEATGEFWVNEIKQMEEQELHPKALEQFMSKQIIDKKYVTKDIDINRALVILAFIYDLNVKYSYKIIKENKYIDKIIDRFRFKNEETKKQMEEIKKIANKYVDSKVKEEK